MIKHHTKKIIIVIAVCIFWVNCRGLVLAQNLDFLKGNITVVNTDKPNNIRAENSVQNSVFKGLIGLYSRVSGILRDKSNQVYLALKPYINNALGQAKGIFGKEYEGQAPGIEKELKKEFQELKIEAPEIIKTIWQKGKNLLNIK